MTEKKMLIMDPADNVGVLLEDAAAGDVCSNGDIRVIALEDIEFCHKIALCDLQSEENAIKYGQKIGYISSFTKKGQWVHRHNLLSERGR